MLFRSAQAERAGEIIRHLRKFVSKEQPESTPVDINELIVEVLTLIRPEASRAGVRIITDLGPDIGAVAAQRIQIDQVIVNLLRNAIDAIAEADSPRREIHILTRMDGDAKRVVTTVADSGPGLDDETRKQLFTPFVTTKPKGMGLGLSISLGIIEAHDGNLFLDTAPGAGAVFRFTLPVIREAE